MNGLYCPECGSKDCPCHVPARDNLNTAADLEIDALKARLDEAVRLLEAERAARQVAETEAERALGVVSAVKHEQDRERQAIKASDCDALCKCAAGRHCTETAPCLRHVLLAERDAARAELAATKAGAAHLQTSLQRANADLAKCRTIITDALAKPGAVS